MITFIDEYDLDPKITATTGLHVLYRDGEYLLKHVPIEGLVIHMNSDPMEFISRLPCNWIKSIKYLRIWYNKEYYCTIYNDMINIETDVFRRIPYLFLENYYKRISGNKPNNIIFTDPPLEIRQYYANMKPNRFVFVSPKFISKYGKSKSLCYRQCIVTTIWLLYFITSRLIRHVRDDGHVIYDPYGSFTDVLNFIHRSFGRGHIRYLNEEETSYIDEVYMNCIAIDILYYGRLCKAHP